MKSQVNNDCFKNTRNRVHGAKCRMSNVRIALLLFGGCILYSGMYAQSAQEEEKIPLTYQSSMVGAGNTAIYDTYLSPLEYSGNNVGIIYEQMNRTGLLNGHVSAQHLFNLEIASTKNPAGTANNYAGSMEYGYGLHYQFKPVHQIQFYAGMQADGLFGFIYNNRNGNNPVAGKVNLNLNVSGMASYKFRIKQQTVQLRYQLNIPVAGVLFSPEFGQSYYEIGKGNRGNLMHFASLHNQRIVRNLLSVELPFRLCILRLAYMNWFYETQVNSLDTRIVSSSFYIGFSKNFYTVPGKGNKKNYRHVFE